MQVVGDQKLEQVKVTTVEKFRGCEEDVLVWIGDDLSISTLDSCTRVTGRLVLVTMARKVPTYASREQRDNMTGSLQNVMVEGCNEG